MSLYVMMGEQYGQTQSPRPNKAEMSDMQKRIYERYGCSEMQKTGRAWNRV